MKYGSICSGIEAASVAWHPLGWSPVFFSEIDPAPIKVLKHRFPHVPIHGDFTTIKEHDYEPIRLLVGGTPCQSFSIAGKRLGLDDPRGNLALESVKLALRLNAVWFLFENVPGLLSSANGEDFAAFLSAITGTTIKAPKDGWSNAGIAKGRSDRYGISWRILDAQHFGVPQRRRRVFVVGYLGDWRPAAAVLFEPESLCGDITPRRETGQTVAPTISARPSGGGGLGTDFDLDGGVIHAPVIMATGQGGAEIVSDGDPSLTCNHEAPIVAHVAPTIKRDYGKGYGDGEISGGLVAHCLRGEGHDASEDGTGRGTPLIAVPRPVAFQANASQSQSQSMNPSEVSPPHDVGKAGAVSAAYAIQERAVSENPDSGPDGAESRADDKAYTLEARTIPQAVAFDTQQITSKTNRTRAEPGLPVSTLSKESRLHVAFDMRGREGGAQFEGPHDTANIRAATGGSSRSYIAGMTVRRLTPVECEFLQGFPRNFTLVPDGKKMMADGPRYKCLGNSMAVPVMRWIGERIARVDKILEGMKK